MEKQLITAALPYANGEIHLGHLLGYLGADAYVRHRRRQVAPHGGEILFVCGDDQHGSAITIRARQEGIAPELLIERLRAAHLQDFQAFGIEFDHYHATHSEENRRLCELVYGRLKEAGLIFKREVAQLFDEQAGIFLADRFVKGGCPACGAAEQYGDSCEKCGATYDALSLVEPVSQVSGSAPSVRRSEHVFFKLSDPRVQAFCRQWAAAPGRLAPDALNKLSEWLSQPLLDWDISRDGPYFGFEIPGEADKFFYVWLDAPLGYLASANAYFAANGRPQDIDQVSCPSSPWSFTHVIGKDILYFHALFWPAVLHFAGLKAPEAVKGHGFLTFGGRKLSKSKGSLVGARQFLDSGLDPESLRFYFLSKFNGSSQDVDFNLDDFQAKVDSSLVGKYANLASRLASFARSQPGVSELAPGHPIREVAAAASKEALAAFDALDFAKGIRAILALLDAANELVSSAKPWLLAKDPRRAGELAQVVAAGLGAFECATRLLAPILPRAAAKALRFLAATDDGREPSTAIEAGRVLGAFEPLARRVDRSALDALVSPPAVADGSL